MIIKKLNPMNITIEWHFVLLVVIVVGLWIWAFKDSPSVWSGRKILALIGTIFLTLLYGGIVWW